MNDEHDNHKANRPVPTWLGDVTLVDFLMDWVVMPCVLAAVVYVVLRVIHSS